MKRLVSVLLVLMMLFGCACAADTKDTLSTIYWLYTMNNDLEDKYIDTALMYLLLYQNERLSKTIGMRDLMGEEGYRMMFDGWIEAIRNICEKKLAYSNGEMTREAFTSYLFTVIQSIVEME